MGERTMNEKGKKQRMFQWQALPSPKMPWETFKRMITMERFKEFEGAERPNEVLRVWRERSNRLIT
jgi:hypothetical protein